jgi:hypothetical protein
LKTQPLSDKKLNGGVIPLPIGLGVARRTAYMWLVVRLFVLLATGTGAVELPAAVLIVAVVVFFRHLDGVRRNEFLFLQNLGVSLANPMTIMIATAGVLELLSWLVLVR